MAATQSGAQEREQSVRNDNIDQDKTEADAKARADFEKAPIKGFEDLPPDHPMALRAKMMADIEAVNQVRDEAQPTDEEAAAAADAIPDDKPVGLDAFREKTDVTPADKPAAKPAAKVTPAADVAAATKEVAPIILDAADLGKYQVRTKIDGVEELVPGTKALGVYQKGAAADVRLANATRMQREAEATLASAKTKAASDVSIAATGAEKATAQSNVEAAAAAQTKFVEASEAMYRGETDAAATLFREAVVLAQAPVPERRVEVATSEESENRLLEKLDQRQSQKSALATLFTDYPEIKTKRAFGIIADEYADAFIANGDDVATAIRKAGEAIGEEYHLGKWAVTTAPTPKTGRPMKGSAPTTHAEKLSAKDELDELTSSNARAVTTEPAEPSVLETLDAMRKARPGQALT